MRLIRFGEKGSEKPGVLIGEGIADLTTVFPGIPDISPVFFSDGWIGKISEKKLQTPLISAKDVRLGPPLTGIQKIICLGKNYAEHAKEGGFDVPEKPILFNKTLNTLNGPYDPIDMPESDEKVDWEVELAVVIGKKAKRVSKSEAESCIAGFTIMNDVSGRGAQFGDSQWYRGKSFDTFAPMGPCIVTIDEMGGLSGAIGLKVQSFVDGEEMQSGNTNDLIFDIPFLIEYISRDITLFPGDVISTGTPSGVGIFRKPPVVLRKGQTVECRIEKIGFIKNICA